MFDFQCKIPINKVSHSCTKFFCAASFHKHNNYINKLSFCAKKKSAVFSGIFVSSRQLNVCSIAATNLKTPFYQQKTFQFSCFLCHQRLSCSFHQGGDDLDKVGKKTFLCRHAKLWLLLCSLHERKVYLVPLVCFLSILQTPRPAEVTT